MRFRTKLTSLIISAGLCFSLVADAKPVKIPQWIFGFTFGAPVAVHRAQCKALKGMWDYVSDMCINPQLVGLGPECNVKGSRIIVQGSNIKLEDGAISSQFSFHHSFAYPGEPAACANKWLEWAHTTFGEPSCKIDMTQFWWENRGSPHEAINIVINGYGSGNSVFVFFIKTSE
jgi:hypothetical protein